MKRALLIIGGLVGGLLAIVVIAVAALFFFIDPNDYKGEIASLVKDKTDMTLAMNDRLSWELWPNIGVKLGKTSLTDDAAKETLVAVDLASVSVQVMPLFSGKIAINAVNLDGAKVRFIQHADGLTSWDRMLKKLSSDEESESQKVDFNIKKMDVKNTSVLLKDEKENIERSIEDVSVTARDIGLDSPFPLSLGFTFRQKDAEGKTLEAKNTLATTLTLNQDNQRYILNKLSANSALSGTLLPAPTTIDLKADIDADMKAEKVSVKNIQLKTLYADKTLRAPAEVEISGEVLADLGATLATIPNMVIKATYPDATRPENITASVDTALTANWTSGDLDATKLALTASVSDKAWPKSVHVNLDSPLKANWLKGDIEIPALLLKAIGIEAKGNFTASLPAMQSTEKDTAITQGMKFDGKLSTNTFNPRQAMAALGIAAPVTADANVLKSVSVATTIEGDDKKALLKNIVLKLDDSTLTGEAGISDMNSMRQYARLALDKMNADRYLPPETPAEKSPAPAAATTNEPLIPVKLVREQNLDVALSAGSLTAMTYPISGFRIAATAANGIVNISELKGTIYNGGFNAPVNLNVQGNVPVIKLQPRLEHMEIGPLAKKLLKKEFVEGKASFNGNLTVRGNTVDEWMKSVTGTSDLKFENGLLHGVNATQEAINALGKYQGLLALTGKDAETIISKQKDTEIASFAVNNTLENGVLNSKSLNADFGKGKVNGSGSFNLATQELDYHFNLNMDKSVVGEKNAGYALPVICKGNLAGNMATLCKLDSKAISDIALKAAAMKGLEKLGLKGNAATPQEAVKQQFEAEKQKAQEKVSEKINEKLNESLQNLFKKKSAPAAATTPAPAPEPAP